MTLTRHSLELDADVALNKATRDQVKAKIAAELEKHGGRADLSGIRKAFPEVPRRTFFRWRRAVLDSGVPQEKAARRLRESIDRDAQRLGSVEAAQAADLAELEDRLPLIPNPADLVRLDISTVSELLNECLVTARQLKKHARGADGKPRNATLLLRASEHQRRVIETAVRIYGEAFDVSVSNGIIREIFNCVAECAPEVARQIVHKIRHGRGALSAPIFDELRDASGAQPIDDAALFRPPAALTADVRACLGRLDDDVRVKEVIETIYNTIADESPETAQKILARLRVVNAEVGIVT